MWRIPSLFAFQLLAYDIAIEFFGFFSYEFLGIFLNNNCTVAYPDFFGILLQQGVPASKKRKLLCRTLPQKGPLFRGFCSRLLFRILGWVLFFGWGRMHTNTKLISKTPFNWNHGTRRTDLRDGLNGLIRKILFLERYWCRSDDHD